MSREKGMLVTCDFCGTIAFAKAAGDGEADGGYTRWNKFEPLPEGWSTEIRVDRKYLDSCPKCTAKYNALMEAAISELKGGARNGMPEN